MNPPGPSTTPSVRVEQVVAATRSLFLRYGYRRTSVDDIAREAGVAKATLYLHFAGKEDIFRTMIRRFREVVNQNCNAAEALEASLEVRLVELLYATYGTTLEWFGDAAHAGELKAFAAEHPVGPFDDAAPALRQRVLHMLMEAEQKGEWTPPPAMAVRHVVQALLWASTGAKRAQKEGSKGMRPALETIVALMIGPRLTG